MASADTRIHPYLRQALQTVRRELVVHQAEAATKFEVVVEQSEEHEYDEQERLRKRRTMSRQVFRGESGRRYLTLMAQLQQEHVDAPGVRTAVGQQLDADLHGIVESASPDDLSGAIRRYDELVSSGQWPTVLCAADAAEEGAAVIGRLTELGLPQVPNEPLGRLGIMLIRVPPELGLLGQIAGTAGLCSVADAATPVAGPRPVGAGAQASDLHALLGLTAETTGARGEGVTVAVLDTGADLSHPALRSVRREDYRNFGGGSDEDADGHGTHVASIIAGHDPSGGFVGVAPGCRLVLAKVLAAAGFIPLLNVLEAMAWAVFEKQADILSLSVGDEQAPATGESVWTHACDEAYRQGTVVCVAAGNPELADEHEQRTVYVPGDSSAAITVGAIDFDRRLWARSAKGSDVADSVLHGKPDCVAPGVDIVAARSAASPYAPCDGRPSYSAQTGTSMAAPVVAGCLALLKSRARSLAWEMTPDQLRQIFFDACHPLVAENGERYSEQFEVGRGLVDMGLVLRKVEQLAPSYAGSETTTRPRADRDPFDPGDVRQPVTPPGPDGFQPNVCYACGKRWLSTVDTFSPAWKCEVCGAPICNLCWNSFGNRRCEKHGLTRPQAPDAGATRQAPPAESAHNEPPRAPVASEPSRESADPELAAPSLEIDPRPGQTFLDRFHKNVSEVGWVAHPTADVALPVRSGAGQVFRRSFGDGRQFRLRAGPRLGPRPRLTLAAVRLSGGGLERCEGGFGPAADILGHVIDGLDGEPKTYYAVGIYSPVGWGDEFTRHVHVRGDAHFYLVERGDSGRWRVFGPEDPLRRFFEPESPSERLARIQKALGEAPELLVSGGQLPLDEFLEEQSILRAVVEEAIRTSGGRLKIIDHRGHSVIQRTYDPGRAR